MIRAVFFDFGGVLIRDEDNSEREVWEKRLGMSPGELAATVFESEAAARASVGEVTTAEMWQYIGERLQLDDKQCRQLQADFFRGDNLNIELLEFAEALQPRYRLAILSNAWSDARRVFSQVYGLDAIFETMIISAEIGLAKPDPRIYHLAVERLDARPEEAIFLDDRLENIEAAQAVGLRAVHFRDNAQAIAEMRAYLDAG
jgi:putative hydrolase of the HAD superfamily